jgi:glycosyltransferase involved in cell wall biosynthesis
MTKVLFLAYHFPPVGGAGVQRVAKFVRYLPELGYEPVVVTGPGGATDLWTPMDETLGGEIPAAARVLRLPGPEPERSSGWRARAERLLEMPSPFARWWIDGACALGREAARDAEVILGELVPYFTAQAAARLARELGKPWVADLQDPWALDEMWLYPTGLHRRLDVARMRRYLRTADAIVMNTPEAVARVRREFPELRAKPIVSIPNGFDESDFASPPAQRDDGIFRIVHSGYLHTELGLSHRRTRRVRRLLGGMPLPDVDILTRSHVYLLAAVERVLSTRPDLRGKIEVHLAGVLTHADREVAARSSAVRLHGYLSHGDTIELLRSADLLFLPMQDLPRGTRAGLVPGKTYEYLASGTPILAAVPDGDARDLLTEAGNAFLCRPSDSDAIAAVIDAQVDRWLAGRLPPEPRPEVLARYERRRQTAELAALFDELVGAKRAAGVARAASGV